MMDFIASQQNKGTWLDNKRTFGNMSSSQWEENLAGAAQMVNSSHVFRAEKFLVLIDDAAPTNVVVAPMGFTCHSCCTHHGWQLGCFQTKELTGNSQLWP
jgi:hypothetical protein